MGLWLLATSALAGTTRLALLVGVNDGGSGRAPLRYAERDAAAIEAVLVELGGVRPEDVVRLGEPEADELRAAIATLDTRSRTLSATGERVEVVLYYSGHADVEGLRLGGTHLPYGELRAAFDGLGADAGLLILDACASGGIVRAKGGQHLVPLWGDLANRATGRAVVTSSAATEASQESDAIGGSFFTLSLVTGLRGAADRDADQRVTLSEAYAYAFDATRFATAATATTQHPTREVQLVGAGDLVVTDLRVPSAMLDLDPALAGRLFVRGPDGSLVVEVSKQQDQNLLVHLPEGTFSLALEAGADRYAGHLTMATGDVAHLSLADLEPVEALWTRSRGGDPDLETREQRRRRALWIATGASLALTAGSGALVVSESGYYPWFPPEQNALGYASSATFVVSAGLSTGLLIGAISNELRRHE